MYWICFALYFLLPKNILTFVMPPISPFENGAKHLPLLSQTQESSTKTASGLADFWETVNSRTFIDKTLFIEFFFKGPNRIVIIAPRHFSKTTNLKMLKAFLEIETAANGENVERNMTKNYRAFESHNLKIFSNAKFFEMHFAKYPVIEVDFGLINATTHQNFLDSFEILVRKLYKEYPYLSKSKKLSRKAIKTFNEVYEPGLPLGIDHLVNSGHQLAELLHQHHDQRCILLIDNYDVPVKHSLMSKTVSKKELDDIVARLGTFIEKLIRGNSFVLRSLFTGCLTVCQIYTLKAGYLDHRSIFRDERLSKFYGFTEQDVQGLATKFNKQSKVDDMRKWYGGYYIEATHILLYNPYSVTQYLNNGTLGPYWFESEGLKSLRPFFDFGKLGEMGEGCVGEDVLIIPHEMDAEMKLHQLKDVFCSDEFSVLYVHRMMQFFMEIGYLTASDRFPNPIVGDAVNIGFPNEETREDFKKLVFTPLFYRTKFSVSDETVAFYTDSIDKLTAESSTFEDFAGSVVKIFQARKPRDAGELLATLHALAVISNRLAHVDMKGSSLFVKRYDNVGVVLAVAFKKSSSKMVLSRILDTRVYENMKKDVKLMISVGLFLDERGHCDVSYVYDKYSLADRQTAVAPTTTVAPPTSTAAPKANNKIKWNN